MGERHPLIKNMERGRSAFLGAYSICACHINRASSTSDIIKLLVRFSVFAVKAFKMIGNEGGQSPPFGLSKFINKYHLLHNTPGIAEK